MLETSRYVQDRMASYWIVVPKGNTELFDLLSVAFRGRQDFSVIVDRRGADDDPPDGDRRGRGLELGPDEFVVAERAEPLKRPAPHVARMGRHATKGPSRRPRRSRERSGASGSRRVRNSEPLASGR